MLATRRVRIAALASIVSLVAACAGTAPSGAPRSTGLAPGAASAAVPTASSGAVGPLEGVTLIDVADAADPVAAAERERELHQEIRDDAGMLALLAARGADGAAVFATLDRIQAEFAQVVLRDAATAVDTGAFPESAVTDPAVGRLASLDGGPTGLRADPSVIDISLFAETGFTTSAIMSMFSELVQRAGETGAGVISRAEPHEEVADGLRQQVDVTTTMSLNTGAGKVRAEITLTATDRIFNASDGSFVALYTSTSTGRFEVTACPDVAGHAEGTYAFETRHELNDVSASAAARSGGARSAEAPFALVNGPDAHLQQIEATLDLKADARGPGSPGGPGPTSPFDWAASQVLGIVMPAGGGIVSGTGQGATVTGTGGERAGGAMLFSSAMAQLFLGQVGKEAERFWRSGKCIDLVPSDDTRDVDPNEEIDLRVEAKEAFAGGTIEQPIVATFTGVTSLSPAGQPVDAPATFHFVAGAELGGRGTIDLKQTSRRGIGLRQVVFTVVADRLEIEIAANARSDAGGSTYASEIHLPPLALAASDDGTYRATGSPTWTTTWRPNLAGCRARTYDGSFVVDVTVRIEQAEPDVALVRVAYVSGGVGEAEVVMCNGYPTPYLGGTFIGAWAALGASDIRVPIGGSTTIETPMLGGSSKQTITIRRPTS